MKKTRESLIRGFPRFLILSYSLLGAEPDQLEADKAADAVAEDGNECSECDHGSENMAKDCQSKCVGRQSPGKAHNSNSLIELLLIPIFRDIGGRGFFQK
jgi:hypothetical protein